MRAPTVITSSPSPPRRLVSAPQGHGSRPRKGLDVLHPTRVRPRQKTASSHRPTVGVPPHSWTPNQPQYEILFVLIYLDCVLICSAPFRSLRAPKRTHPFNSLPHLARPTAHRALRTVPRSISYEDRRLPRAAGSVFTILEHDVQGDAVAIASLDMGTS